MTEIVTHRQGDVLLRKIPDDFKWSKSSWEKPSKVKDNILAFGEGSGHAHIIEGDNEDFTVEDGVIDNRQSEGKKRVVKVGAEGAKLVHRNVNTGKLTGDHSEIELATGTYEMVPQQEMDDQKVVRVID